MLPPLIKKGFRKNGVANRATFKSFNKYYRGKAKWSRRRVTHLAGNNRNVLIEYILNRFLIF